MNGVGGKRMIVANVRRQLKRDDAQLALRLVGRESSADYERAEATLREGGIDELLDEPRLLEALVESRQGACASYPLFAYVVVRHALLNVGEQDRVLADYVASILLHFGFRDRAARIGDADDEAYTTLVDLSGAVNGPDLRRNFMVRAHLGNYALWLSGLFPDYVEGRHFRRGAPDLGYYEEMGRRGYTLAAAHQLAQEHGLVSLFNAAAERFATLRVALNRVSDTHLFPNVHSANRLLRQVRDEARWRLAS
jgi:hypothetical protein